MTVLIPSWVLACGVPWCIAFLLSLRVSNVKTGGGWWGPSSERDGYWFLAFPFCVVLSLLIAVFYWMGVAKGWF